jgi:bacteriocin biosynthesis cyclodehydratase domain-containing protein
LPLKPRIPGYFAVVPMAEDRLQLRSPRKTVVLSGTSVKAVSRMIGLMDGTREVEDIIGSFPEIPREEVIRALRRLFDKGIVEDAAEAPGAESAQERFFSAAGRNGRLVQEVVRQSRVAVVGLGRVGSHAVAALARAGVGVISGVDDAAVDDSLPGCGGLYLPEDVGRTRTDAVRERLGSLRVSVRFESIPLSDPAEGGVREIVRGQDVVLVCQDSPAVTVYREVNEAALRERVRWLRASLEGFEAYLGPCVLPFETACYTCYESRLKGNWPYYEENLAFEESLSSGCARPDYGCSPAAAGFVGNLAALEVLKLLTGFSYPVTCGKMWVFSVDTFEARAHTVLKLPRCPSCGFTADSPARAQWSL